MIWASCARFSSSQNTVGTFVARARLTASLTQFWMGASLTWHALQMSPFSTWCSMSVWPEVLMIRTVPLDGIRNVLSCEPYSSAFCAMSPTLGTVPMVVGSNAPFFIQKSMVA